MRRVDLVKAAREGDLDTVKKILSENFEFKHNELDIALSHSFRVYIIESYNVDHNNMSNIYSEIIIELLKSGACLSKYASNDYFLWFYNTDSFRNTNGGLDILLWYFSRDGDLELVELLIDCGANIYSYDAEYGFTPLSIASKNGHIEIVEFLIDLGINVNYNINGKTSLMYASEEGHFDIVEKLIEAGADLNLKDNDSKTVLSIAIDKGYSDIVELLKSRGAY